MHPRQLMECLEHLDALRSLPARHPQPGREPCRATALLRLSAMLSPSGVEESSGRAPVTTPHPWLSHAVMKLKQHRKTVRAARLRRRRLDGLFRDQVINAKK